MENQFYRVIGRQRGREFGALAHFIERITTRVLEKYIVPAAERVGADLFEIVVPQIAEVDIG